MVYIFDDEHQLALGLRDFIISTAEKMLTKLECEKLDISIKIAGPEEALELNKRFRQKDYVPDILSFPALELQPGEKPEFNERDLEANELGDLLLCLPAIKKDAKELGKTLEERLEHLLAHGLCHLLGYSHESEKDDKVMKDLEKTLQAKESKDNKQNIYPHHKGEGSPYKKETHKQKTDKPWHEKSSQEELEKMQEDQEREKEKE